MTKYSLEKFYKKKLNQIYCCDCLKAMKAMPSDSIDLIVTDPPYGLKFMGKNWDKAVPPIEVWKECLRVLKPGAFAFVMSSPRQDCLAQMIIRLEKAGFQVGFTSIYWTYASGFPKAGDACKLAMKRLNDEGRVVGMEKIDKGIQKGSMHAGRSTEIVEREVKKPTLPETKALQGGKVGFQPKPAVEIILICMKPLSEKSYIEQALKNKKGITWLDDCRIPYENKDEMKIGGRDKPTTSTKTMYGGSSYFESKTKAEHSPAHEKGRFPANLLVSDGVLDDGKIRKAGKYKGEGSKSGGIWRPSTGKPAGREYGDSGSYSRYFSLDSWWRERIKRFPEDVKKTFPFLICSKASKREKNKGLEDFQEKEMPHSTSMKCGNCGLPILSGTTKKTCSCKVKKEIRHKMKNTHPTCKPVKLISYLIILGSRKEDVILDPYIGSGTTAIAAKMLGRKFVGFEISPEYCEIAKARLKKVGRNENK